MANLMHNIGFVGNIAITGRTLGKQGAEITSASIITLGNDGNLFKISGHTTVNGINKEGWTAGSKITLTFDDTIELAHLGISDPNYLPLFFSIQLANVSVNEDSVIEFVLDLDNNYWTCTTYNL